MENTKDTLRAVADNVHNKRRKEQIRAEETRKEEVFVQATLLFQEAASEGLYEATVYTAESYDMDLSGCGYSLLDDSEEVVEEAKLRLSGLGIDKLRGIAGELRDYLLGEGLGLSLRMRTGGHGCKNARYVWDMVASW